MSRQGPVLGSIVALLVLLGLACSAGSRGATEATTGPTSSLAIAAPTDTPKAVPAATEPLQVEETPEREASGVRWRLTSVAADDELPFTAVTGMDATATMLLVADAYGGIYGFEMVEGALALLASPGEIGYVADVAAGSDGRLYMADRALHQVTMFDAEGSLLGAFGVLGPGDGEFGGDSPRALAVGPTGEVFVLDPYGDAAGAPLLRVQVFGPEGDFRRRFELDPAWDVQAMDVGPDDTLFVVGPGGFLGELEPEEGRLIQQLGREVLAARSPQSVAVDDTGTIFVATQVPAAVAVLTSLGDLVGWIGEEGVRTDEGWDAGTFLFPSVVAVTPDGQSVFVGDMYPPFAYVTAMSVGD